MPWPDNTPVPDPRSGAPKSLGPRVKLVLRLRPGRSSPGISSPEIPIKSLSETPQPRGPKYLGGHTSLSVPSG